MPSSYHDLFRTSSASEKLDWFQSLLESKELTFAEGLALLSSIRSEMEKPKAHRSSIYVRYGRLMDSLQKEMPDVYDEIVGAWRAKRDLLPSEPGSMGEPVVPATRMSAQPEDAEVPGEQEPPQE